MPHPFFESVTYPWHRADARALHKELYSVVTKPDRIDVLYKGSGEGLRPLPGPPADVIWKAALEELTAAHRMQKFCELLLADQNLASVHKAVEALRNAQSVIEQYLLDAEGSSEFPFINRKNLRVELDKLGSTSPAVRVLLVRGDSMSGRTWTRYLVENKASELGEGPIVYLFDGNVANVNGVVRAIFSAIAELKKIPARNTTEDAWYMDVLDTLQDLVATAKRHMWIVADDLGLGDDNLSPKLDPAIRSFFEQFALFMANPAFAQWFRLILLEYPRGNVPTKWKKGFWVEEDTSLSAPNAADVAKFLIHWSMKTKKKLAVEQAEQLAAQIVANAQAIVMSAQAAQPRRRLGLWEAVHDEVVLSVSKL